MQETSHASISLINDRGVEKVKVSIVKGNYIMGFMRPLKPKPKVIQ